jgi:ABC-2 type transport system permease protein
MTTSTPSRASGSAGTRTIGPGAANNPFTGSLALARLALRRDRMLIPVWLAVFVATAAGTATSTLDIYPTEASRHGIATMINTTTALRALYGPIFDENSAGAVVLFKVGTFGAALVALLGIVLTVRHTRAEEETGRLELLGAGVVGRFASLTAALTVSALTSAVLAVLTALSLIGVGLSVPGSVAFGASWGLSGIAFAAVAAIAAQLTTSARAATGLASLVLGATYLLRAVGDTASEGGPTWLSWLSPVGWSQQIRPFAGNRWWVAGLSVVFSVLAGLAAYSITAHRDLGAGAFPDRPGPAVAGRLLSTPDGLALRLHRGTLLAWTCAFALLGSVLGGIVSNIDTAFSSDAARQLISRLGGTDAMVDAYLATELSFVGVFVSAFGVQAVLRQRAEEAVGHAEPILATAVTRRRWAAGHLLVAVLGSTWLLLVSGLTAGASTTVSTDDGSRFGQVLTGSLIQLPAVLVVLGIAFAANGLLPRAASAIGWGMLVAFLLLGELGPVLRLNQWIMDLSPYTHTPRVPGTTLTVMPLIWLGVVAVVLIAAGFESFRRRDLE